MTQARNLSRLLNKDITTYMYTATAGQTAFTGSDDNSQTLTFDNQSIMVTYNGVMLEKGSEFTVAANTVTLLAGAEVNAEVNIIVFNNASLGGYVKNTGGDIDGGVNITSGNLLVGTTSMTASDTSGTGMMYANGVALRVKRESSGGGQPCLDLNNTGSDDVMAMFRKDGVTVGSIGVGNSDNLFIQGNSSHAGIQFGTNSAMPHTNGNTSDNAEDLGTSNTRWKDLYLSGGVYLGGTGSANKLDSYEQGNWTPTVASSSGTITTLSAQAGVYTKVGKVVTLHFQFVINTLGSAGGTLLVTNLPFTRETSVLTYYGGFWRARSGISSIAEINPSNTCYLYGASPIVSTYFGSLFYKTA